MTAAIRAHPWVQPAAGPSHLPDGGRAGSDAPAVREADATAACNIGPAELRRRRRSAAVVAAALAVALLAVAADLLPRWSLPFLAPLVGAVVGTLLQVFMRFCLAFGFAGLVGMGQAPGATAVDPMLRTAHRRRAALMVLVASLAALAWAIVTGVLALAGT